MDKYKPTRQELIRTLDALHDLTRKYRGQEMISISYPDDCPLCTSDLELYWNRMNTYGLEVDGCPTCPWWMFFVRPGCTHQEYGVNKDDDFRRINNWIHRIVGMLIEGEYERLRK